MDGLTLPEIDRSFTGSEIFHVPYWKKREEWEPIKRVLQALKKGKKI